MTDEIQPRRFTLTSRSNTTSKTHTEEIQVWPDQDPQQVAERIATGYGAQVESLTEITNDAA